MKYILSQIFLIITVLYSFTQDCTEYHQFHCLYADNSFVYSSHSKSELYSRGQTSEIKLEIYEGEDYYVSVCANRKFGDIRFKIMEDNDDSTLIYDNADNDYDDSVIFTNDVTRNIIIEVSVPGGTDKGKTERRCVGIVIESRKTQPPEPERSKNKRH